MSLLFAYMPFAYIRPRRRVKFLVYKLNNSGIIFNVGWSSIIFFPKMWLNLLMVASHVYCIEHSNKFSAMEKKWLEIRFTRTKLFKWFFRQTSITKLLPLSVRFIVSLLCDPRTLHINQLKSQQDKKCNFHLML